MNKYLSELRDCKHPSDFSLEDKPVFLGACPGGNSWHCHNKAVLDYGHCPACRRELRRLEGDVIDFSEYIYYGFEGLDELCEDKGFLYYGFRMLDRECVLNLGDIVKGVLGLLVFFSLLDDFIKVIVERASKKREGVK